MVISDPAVFRRILKTEAADGHQDLLDRSLEVEVDGVSSRVGPRGPDLEPVEPELECHVLLLSWLNVMAGVVTDSCCIPLGADFHTGGSTQPVIRMDCDPGALTWASRRQAG
jgi:hypothetical protein